MEINLKRQDFPGSVHTAFLYATGVDASGSRFSTHVCYKPGKIVEQGIPGIVEAVLGKGTVWTKWRVWNEFRINQWLGKRKLHKLATLECRIDRWFGKRKLSKLTTLALFEM